MSEKTDDSGNSTDEVVTAAILVIGDEILSGRTKDKNIGYIAEYLTNIGVDLREVRQRDLRRSQHLHRPRRIPEPGQGLLPRRGALTAFSPTALGQP